jgi:hypothetical protein
MQPHQERVIAERRELADKIDKLGAFIAGPVCEKIDAAEAERLALQHKIMQQYADILDRRIEAFGA